MRFTICEENMVKISYKSSTNVGKLQLKALTCHQEFTVYIQMFEYGLIISSYRPPKTCVIELSSSETNMARLSQLPEKHNYL